MPNRILKESVCTSDSVNKLSWFEEVLFYRLIVNCDDYGRFDGRVSIIKNRLFPLKENLTGKTVAEAISKLESAGLVALYEFEGKPYLYLPGWNDHQNVRAKKSKYPEPKTEHNNTNVGKAQHGNTCETPLHSDENTCKQMNTDDCNGNPMHNKESKGIQANANVPVIQSESVSISESLSESISESLSGTVASDARAGYGPGGEPEGDLGGKESECLKIVRTDGRESYGVHQQIFLSPEEYRELVETFGQINVECMIIRMDRWLWDLENEGGDKPLGNHCQLLKKKLWKERVIPDGN